MSLRGKHRAALQRAQADNNLWKINTTDQENIKPDDITASFSSGPSAAMHELIQKERDRGDDYKRRLRNEFRKRQRADNSRAELRVREAEARRDLATLEQNLTRTLERNVILHLYQAYVLCINI